MAMLNPPTISNCCRTPERVFHCCSFEFAPPAKRKILEIERRTEALALSPGQDIVRLDGAILPRPESLMAPPAPPLHDPGNHRAIER